MGLDRDRIARAAVAILDAEGAPGLTMRRLAAEVGAAPMTAYTHVKNKRDLVDLALASVIGGVDLPEPDGRLRRPVRRLATDLRDALRAHPGVAQLAREAGLGGAAAGAICERVEACLGAAGVGAEDAAAGAAAVVSLVLLAPMRMDGPDTTFTQAVEIVLAGVAGRRGKRSR
jgi:AcrR family transcriptional regulator